MSHLIKEQLVLEEEELVTLEKQVALEQKSSIAYAAAKQERILKAGVSQSLLLQYQQQINTTNAKKDDEIAKLKVRLESLEEKHRLAIADYERKKEKLKEEMACVEAKAKTTLNYFQPLVDKCYEPLPLDPSLPPSHYKKVERVKELKESIERKKSLLEMVRRAERAGEEKEGGVSSKIIPDPPLPTNNSSVKEEAARELAEIQERLNSKTEERRKELEEKTEEKFAAIEADLRKQREAARLEAASAAPSHPPVIQSSRVKKPVKQATSAF